MFSVRTVRTTEEKGRSMTIDVVTSEPSLRFNQEHLEVASRELLFNFKTKEEQHLAVRFEAEIRYDLDAEQRIERTHGTFTLHDITGTAAEPLYFVELHTKQRTTHRGLLLAQRANSRRVYIFQEGPSDRSLVEVILDSNS